MQDRLHYEDYIDSLVSDKVLESPHVSDNPEISEQTLRDSSSYLGSEINGSSNSNNHTYSSSVHDPSLESSSAMNEFNSVWEDASSLEDFHRKQADKRHDVQGSYHQYIQQPQEQVQQQPEVQQPSDPVINIVAPDENQEGGEFNANEFFPMYTADGTPLDDMRTPNFTALQQSQVTGEHEHTSPYAVDPPPAGHPLSPPQNSPHGASSLMAPGTPNDSRHSLSPSHSSSGSPVLSGVPLSPYEDLPYDTMIDSALSPLVDNDQRYFDDSQHNNWEWSQPAQETYPNFRQHKASSMSPAVGPSADPTVPQLVTPDLDLKYGDSYRSGVVGVNGGGVNDRGTGGSSLQVPSRRNRAHSDSWSSHQRDLFLDSLDAQVKFASSDAENKQNILSFPSYTPVNVHTHTQNIGGSRMRSPSHHRASANALGLLKPEQTFVKEEPSYENVAPQEWSSSGYGSMQYHQYDQFTENQYGKQYTPDHFSAADNSNSTTNTMININENINENNNITNNHSTIISDPTTTATIPASPAQVEKPYQNHLVVSNTTRGRSLSSPYEQTNDLKLSQMFSCDLCGKKFTRAYNLRSHMRTHTDERPFACQHCGKAFARQHDRKRHEALHSGQKKFTCFGVTQGFSWGCQKRFARADALGRHFRTEAGKNCLRPVIERIQENGTYKETAPEGILFNGFVDNKPQLFLNIPRRDSVSGMSNEEREEQTRRTVIVTAVAEHLQELATKPQQHQHQHAQHQEHAE